MSLNVGSGRARRRARRRRWRWRPRREPLADEQDRPPGRAGGIGDRVGPGLALRCADIARRDDAGGGKLGAPAARPVALVGAAEAGNDQNVKVGDAHGAPYHGRGCRDDCSLHANRVRGKLHSSSKKSPPDGRPRGKINRFVPNRNGRNAQDVALRRRPDERDQSGPLLPFPLAPVCEEGAILCRSRSELRMLRFDPFPTFPVGAWYGRNAHMSGPSVEPGRLALAFELVCRLQEGRDERDPQARGDPGRRCSRLQPARRRRRGPHARASSRPSQRSDRPGHHRPSRPHRQAHR